MTYHKYFSDDALVSIFNPYQRGHAKRLDEYKGNEKLTGRRLLQDFRQVVVASLKTWFVLIFFLLVFYHATVEDDGVGPRNTAMPPMSP